MIEVAETYFYEPRQGHGLPHDPFKAIVAPRPIGWISTLDAEGRVNLAPYSYFNAVSSNPPIVMFSSEGLKHTVANAAATGEFVASLATEDLRHAMNLTSASLPAGHDEMRHAGLTPAPSRLVGPPRVAESPAALECKVLSVTELADIEGRKIGRYLVLGQVVGVHIDPAMIEDGHFATAKARALARCGYRDYAVVASTFELARPE
jgi:flavin reductase (DIM6/NTAB) family NADH-FMN oxidoreductase RutF